MGNSKNKDELMKKFFTIVASSLLFAGSVAAQEPETINPINVDLSGWTWSTLSEDKVDGLSMFRLRADADLKNFDIFLEADLTEGFEGNWFRQAFLTFDVSENTDLYVGRLFTAAATTTPPPFLLKTGTYMRAPFSAFGYGVQIKHSEGPLDILIDVTGSTALNFDEGNQFDRIESSARVTYNVSKEFQIGGAYQISSDFNRFAIEATIKPWKNHNINSAVYKTNATSGGFIFYGYQPKKWIELHTMLDYQENADTLTYVGTRFIFGKVQLVLDHELAKGNTTARVQVRF